MHDNLAMLIPGKSHSPGRVTIPGSRSRLSISPLSRYFHLRDGVRSPAGARRGRGDHRPNPAPFPADDGTQSPPVDDRHSGRWRTQNGRGSTTGKVQRPSAPRLRAGESPPPPVGRRWTIGRRRGRDGRVKWRAAAGWKSRRAARRRDAIADRMPGMGDHRPAVGRWPTLRAVGTFDVCSNAAVNSWSFLFPI